MFYVSISVCFAAPGRWAGVGRSVGGAGNLVLIPMYKCKYVLGGLYSLLSPGRCLEDLPLSPRIANTDYPPLTPALTFVPARVIGILLQMVRPMNKAHIPAKASNLEKKSSLKSCTMIKQVVCKLL